MEVFYTLRAEKDLDLLEKSIAKRIVRKVEQYSNATDPLVTAKSLSGSMIGLYRYRVGDYRVIFEVGKSGTVTILSVLTIKHRKDVYR